jgi:flagellar biogenesis protein FliO
MASKLILVILLFLGNSFATDTIPSKENDKQPFYKNNVHSLSAEELKSEFGVASKINLWRYFGKIILIFILLVGLIFIISKFAGNNSFIKNNTKTNNHLNILYQQYLSSKQKIILVKAFDKYLLLGISEQSINLLTEFNKNEIDENQINSTNSKSIFSSLLGRYIQNEK